MVVSCLEQRLLPLTTSVPAYSPLGPLGMPPCMEEGEGESEGASPSQEGGRKGRRCRTWSGYMPHTLGDMQAPGMSLMPSWVPSLDQLPSREPTMDQLPSLAPSSDQLPMPRTADLPSWVLTEDVLPSFKGRDGRAYLWNGKEEEEGAAAPVGSSAAGPGPCIPNYAHQLPAKVHCFRPPPEELAIASHMTTPTVLGTEINFDAPFDEISMMPNIARRGGSCIMNRTLAPACNKAAPGVWEEAAATFIKHPYAGLAPISAPRTGSAPNAPRGSSMQIAGNGKACDSQADITTLMVQNLPRHLSQREFLAELDSRGFAGLYDFCHLPMSFDTGRNKGFAFVNLVSVNVAHAFQEALHECYSWGTEPLEKALRVVPAEVQGFKANAAKAFSKKMRRVRNAHFKPVLAGHTGNEFIL